VIQNKNEWQWLGRRAGEAGDGMEWSGMGSHHHV